MLYRDRNAFKFLIFVLCLLLVLGYLIKKQGVLHVKLLPKHNNFKQPETAQTGTEDGNLNVEDRYDDYDDIPEMKLNADTLAMVKNITGCSDKPRSHTIKQWGTYWVLGSYVPSKKHYKCEESVTYATTATFYFLNNLPTIVKRWKGPVSVAVYAPGSDFLLTMESIAYLRECSSPLIQKLVSFHIFFEIKYSPDKVIPYEDFVFKGVNCSQPPPYESFPKGQSFKEKNKAPFMINLARNIAREMSETHFILSSDMELYPSANLVPLFLKMIAKSNDTLQEVVYALQTFEVQESEKPPLKKATLRKMVEKGVAQPFHHKMCAYCHDFPSTKEWLQEDSEGMYIFSRTKRTGRFQAWEPFFIGTNQDPWYDERVSWEGMRDKRIQAYALCLLGYDFLVPSNAFLVHKPGIKKTEFFGDRYQQFKQTKQMIDTVILPQYQKIYGSNSKCDI